MEVQFESAKWSSAQTLVRVSPEGGRANVLTVNLNLLKVRVSKLITVVRRSQHLNAQCASFDAHYPAVVDPYAWES